MSKEKNQGYDWGCQADEENGADDDEECGVLRLLPVGIVHVLAKKLVIPLIGFVSDDQHIAEEWDRTHQGFQADVDYHPGDRQF